MSTTEAIALSGTELEGLRLRVQARQLLDSDYPILEKVLSTVQSVARLLEKKRASVARLRKMLFGPHSEKSQTVVGTKPTDKETKGKRKGHGRRRVNAYWGAQREEVSHGELAVGQRCPDCDQGTLFAMKKPSEKIWFHAHPPIQATIYACERLRCSGCGTIFTAAPPQEANRRKYDESVGSSIALFRFGNGMPHYRLGQMQSGMGVPLPPSVQWQLLKEKADSCGGAIYESLYRSAAQADLIRVDDTKMKVLWATGQSSGGNALPQEPNGTSSREGKKGTRTTAILSRTDEHPIVVYVTGTRHAGQNMDWLLARREASHRPPIQMCDGLAHNLPKQFQVILANCLAHARRKVLEVLEPFPPEVEIVLWSFACVYANDEEAERQNLSAPQRLEFHQLRSGFLMEGLRDWMQAQMERKKVEPNSVLGQAFTYMLKRWEPLTLFLRVPAAPLDNNLCEIVVKRAIMHRKNSLFYKTSNGAAVGDIFMSIISTCIMNKVDPFPYLTEIEKHAAEVRGDPENWLPWNYHLHLTGPPR